MSIEEAIKALHSAGVEFHVPALARSFSLISAAHRLDVSAGWVRDHLEEFPNRYRLPGGGQNGGEWRIPAKDIEAFEAKRRVAA